MLSPWSPSKVSSAVLYMCLPIFLGRFPELLLHWSLSFTGAYDAIFGAFLEYVSGGVG